MLSPDDIANILAIQEEAFKYKPKSGRYNPFDLNRIKMLILNNEYSVMLDKRIETPEEAAWHGKCETEQWAFEDAQETKQIRRQQNLKRQRDFQARKKAQVHPEVTAAFNQLQEAVKQRKKAIAEWDKYVEQIRHYYTMLRAKHD